MTRFRGAIEAKLKASAEDGDIFQPTAIYDCLVLDCADVGVPEVEAMSTSVDCAGDARLGVAYVLEGSTLGASLLIRSAAELGFDANHGARHLARQVDRRANWTTFVGYLEGRQDLDMTKVIEAANATFLFALSAAKEGVDAASSGSQQLRP
jgi:heme oxygenase